MKKTMSKYIVAGMLVLLATCMDACKKEETPDGVVKGYLVAALNTVYTVPGNPKNYIADKLSGQLRIPVYVAFSGWKAKSGIGVQVAADNVTAQQLIDKGTVDKNKVIVAPADAYILPASATITADSAYFPVSFPVSKLQAYPGKQLLLSVRISNPSAFSLNDKLSVLNILVDVDLVVLGTKVEVTSQYLKNTVSPFQRSDNNTDRRGILAVWTTSDAVKNFNNGTLGGFDDYGGGGYMSMERYGSPQIPNGKIYQTVTLPAARYSFEADFESFGIVDQAFLAAAAGNTLPDVGNIGSALGYTPFASPKMEFEVSQQQAVSIGIVANLIQDLQWFRLRSVKLYQYQNIFQ